MHSTESRYIDDGKATGFIKPYAGHSYSFAALLPNEGIDISEYINSLTGVGFIDAIKNAEDTVVHASMPKFKFEYDIARNDALKSLGMPEAFDETKAEFKKMATSSIGNIYIGEYRRTHESRLDGETRLAAEAAEKEHFRYTLAVKQLTHISLA